MKFAELSARREWVSQALEQLELFVIGDPDFRGQADHELEAIEKQRALIASGKYRVVFLGTFNVGKSTAINAFLGGAYLPMDVEECTSQLTYIQRGPEQELVILLREAATEKEIEAFRQALEDTGGGEVTVENEGKTLRVQFGLPTPDGMRKSLEPLVTVMADDDFPELAPLRERIEELNLFLPASVLTEDIAFVDTPGVHSVSDTRQEITYGVIERSHLVISFVDSSFAGNIHDLNFIKRIIKWRGRRVFFVLNKADKLESTDIDIRGARGPARSLFEAFERHGLPDDSEVFFLSGYRALRAQQLEKEHLRLEAVLDDNKISLPTSVQEKLQESKTPEAELAAYLMQQSRFPQLKERLMDFLVQEDKTRTLIETAVKFVGQRSDDYVASLENELHLAKDPGRFEELRANREKLMAELTRIRASAERVLNEYNAKSKGGRVGQEESESYEEQFRAALTESAIQSHIIQPVLFWLRESDNLKQARRSQFKTLSAQVEAKVDDFVSAILRDVNGRMDTAEEAVRDAVSEQLAQIRGLRIHMTAAGKVDLSHFDTSMTGSYVAFGASGAALGAAAGAALGSVVPVVGTAIGAGLGGLLGAMSGFLTRLAWNEDRWLKKLEPAIRENVMNMLIHGVKDEKGSRVTPVVEAVSEYINRRADAFLKAVRNEVDSAIRTVQNECDDLLAREEEIRRESEAIITRLEPKVAQLQAIREEARHTLEAVFHRETVRV